MKNDNHRLRHSFVRSIAIAAAALFTACDTSSSYKSGIEGTGSPTPVAIVAIAAVSRGPIQSAAGLDVAVNDVLWYAPDAQTVIDGAASTPASLKPGMMATVQGQRTASDRGTANVIETQIVVRGPIFEVDAPAYRVNVLGQTILIDRRTTLDMPGASLGAFSIGQVVAVSGFVTANGAVQGTRVAMPPDGSAQDWEVNGTVTAVASGGGRFSINGLEIQYTADLLASRPAGLIGLGQPVSVRGTALTTDGALIATSIAPYDTGLPATSGETVLSGVIARVEGDDISFWTQRITLVPGATITGSLAAGTYVRARGTMQGEVLRANDVIVLGSGPVYIYLVGFVDAVNAAARTLTLFGIPFGVSETVDLTNVVVGQRVRVVAYENRFISHVEWGGGWPYAAEGLVLVEGKFGDLSPPLQFTLHGVRDWGVHISSGTMFFSDYLAGDGECYGRDRFSPESFWNAAAQPESPEMVTAYVWGRFEGGIVLARSVGICYRP